ncbi:Alpha/beta hydrolase fold-1 [Microdochium bolleyi]|uniref:Alpha/beta hydrolase fold-1 n=1 Tax=Microdochium bolleyi TaxID=196109 RepID=A0A136ISY0_9PEZI|nr:Alpha/beta hydrolase fold-1 [Microdochium bolleyi]
MASTSSKPTIVFAPGAWHTPDCFDIVRHALQQRGWATESVNYPTVGAEPPTKGLADDAAAVRSAVEALADQGKEVVLVVHSYGGLVGANAVEGLGYKQRAKQGMMGGVIMFVYLAAFVTPNGKTIKEMLGGQFLPWMRFEGNYVYPDTPEVVFYHDVEPELQKQAIAKLKHQSAPVFTDPVTYEPWHEIDCMYFFCDGDKALPLPVQQQMATFLGPVAASFHTKGSHSPFLSEVQEVVEGLEHAARVGQEKSKA